MGNEGQGDGAGRPRGRMGLPLPVPPPPGTKKRRTAGGGYPILGLGLGSALAFFLPGIVFGVVTSIADGFTDSAWLLAPGLIAAIVIPLAIFLFILARLDRSDPQQESIRVAMIVAGVVSVALYALAGLLIGACIAIIVSAY